MKDRLLFDQAGPVGALLPTGLLLPVIVIFWARLSANHSTTTLNQEAVWQTTHMIGKAPSSNTPANVAEVFLPKRASRKARGSSTGIRNSSRNWAETTSAHAVQDAGFKTC